MQQYKYGNYTITSTDIRELADRYPEFHEQYWSAVQSRLLCESQAENGGSTRSNFVPGLEIDSTGNLTLNTPWNLSTWRFGANSAPGMLTLRAAGDLLIDQNLLTLPPPCTVCSAQRRSPPGA